MAALALLPFVVVGAQASAMGLAMPAGCDPSRPGVQHGADAADPEADVVVPCLTYAFFGFGEANVTVSSSGSVMYGGAYIPTPQEIFRPAYEISGNIARSVDQGGTWNLLVRPAEFPLGPGPFPPPGPPPGNPLDRGAGDPRVYRDPLTDRVFFHNIGSSYGFPNFPDPDAFQGLCRTEISYTDDGGDTWVDNPFRDMNGDAASFGCFPGFAAAFDFPHLFTAPPTTSAGEFEEGDYPNVVYICKRSFALGNVCWKSLDSLETLIPLPPDVNQHLTGGPRGTGGLDGTIYAVTGNQLHYSVDEATTWTVAPGVTPIPVTQFAVDSDGTVYGVGTSDGKPELTYTTDMGTTWSDPIAVQAPGVNHAHDAVIAVPAIGTPGPVAVAYVSSETEDTVLSPFNQLGGVHNGYVVTTDDVFAENPVFHSVQVDSDEDPLLPFGFPATGNTTTFSRADYIGLFFDEEDALQIDGILEFFDQSVDAGTLTGRAPLGPLRLQLLRSTLVLASKLIDGGGTPWAYFYKDLCGAPGVCDCPKEGVCEEPNPHPIATNWLGSVATVTDEVTQKRDTGACLFLKLASFGTDGEPPVDPVEGPAAPELNDQIETLIGRMCG